MKHYILLMHGDAETEVCADLWGAYLDGLGAKGALRGGSEIGSGTCMRLTGPTPEVTKHLVGYVNIEARDLDHAQQLVTGNPVYDAGGTVEIRELPRSA